MGTHFIATYSPGVRESFQTPPAPMDIASRRKRAQHKPEALTADINIRICPREEDDSEGSRDSDVDAGSVSSGRASPRRLQQNLFTNTWGGDDSDTAVYRNIDPTHRRHLAEGVLAGVGAVELLSNHQRRMQQQEIKKSTK
jgi:hypothetical protein